MSYEPADENHRVQHQSRDITFYDTNGIIKMKSRICSRVKHCSQTLKVRIELAFNAWLGSLKCCVALHLIIAFLGNLYKERQSGSDTFY